MKKERWIEDEKLGHITITESSRARRLTFRVREGRLHATVPVGTPLLEINRVIQKLYPRLQQALAKQSQQLIDLNYRIETEFFKLHILQGERERFLARSELGEMQIIAPVQADFTDPELQTWLRKVILEALRRNAKIILPARLYMLAGKHGLTYHTAKINSSRGRWGSCSTQRDINLSCYLILLPSHLMDYVLLHELAHTQEMNHSPRFWALLNKLTDGKAEALRQELKQYKTDF